MQNPLSKLISNLKLKTGDGKKPTKLGYVLIVALIGLLLLIVGNMFQSANKDQNLAQLDTQTENLPSQEEETFMQKDEETKTDVVDDIETSYEKDLTELLEQIQGVSEVEVMVNLNSTHKKVYEKNLVIGTQTTEEIDQNGGERVIKDNSEEQQVVIVRQGDKEVPLLVQTTKPEVRGVLVVAKGADHLEVKGWVIEAVSRVLDVPTHKISVMPKN
ncbi:stage III sporulation protein AG [Radiobacillus sp. PE A8.2]|uniref:stage III sporulation protein AG n=1 Tax=Radiobacillus sp. PE A8.2 TaxID=3380349 RepID=UPI00388F7E57